MDIKRTLDSEEWTVSAKNTLQWVSTTDAKKSIMLILRHSHRETLRDHSQMGSAGLTELGKQMSVEVGRRIPSGRPMELFTSFVPRAYETAEGISEGYSEIGEEVIDINLLPSLVSPRILNPEIWGKLHPDGKNITEYVNQWVNGEFEGFIEPFEEFQTKLMGDTVKRLTEAKEKTIYVCTTHDFTLMSAKRMFLGRNLVHEDREPFLGGLGITPDGSDLELFIACENISISIRR